MQSQAAMPPAVALKADVNPFDKAGFLLSAVLEHI